MLRGVYRGTGFRQAGAPTHHALPANQCPPHAHRRPQRRRAQHPTSHTHAPACRQRQCRCNAEPREAAHAEEARAAAPAGGASGTSSSWAFASSISRRVNLDLALTEATEAALKTCGPAEPDVAFVFASSAYGQALDLLVPLLRRLLPTARCIVGCTGFGVCGVPVEGGVPEEVEHAPAVALALGAFPGVQLMLRHVQLPDVPDGGERRGGTCSWVGRGVGVREGRSHGSAWECFTGVVVSPPLW